MAGSNYKFCPTSLHHCAASKSRRQFLEACRWMSPTDMKLIKLRKYFQGLFFFFFFSHPWDPEKHLKMKMRVDNLQREIVLFFSFFFFLLIGGVCRDSRRGLEVSRAIPKTALLPQRANLQCNGHAAHHFVVQIKKTGIRHNVRPAPTGFVLELPRLHQWS